MRFRIMTHEVRTDHVIAATGFEVDIDRLKYLEPALRAGIARERGGIPALSSNFESSIPGLFMVGVANSPVFDPIIRFLYGAKHVAPALALRMPLLLARRISAPRAAPRE